MNFKIKDIKKEARELLSDKWHTVVLGFFIPFLLGIVLMYLYYNGIDTSVENKSMLLVGILDFSFVSFIQSLISYAFLVGVYNYLIFTGKSPKKEGGFFRILFVSFSSLWRVVVPVVFTRVVFSVTDYILNIEFVNAIYDLLLFSYISYPVCIIVSQLLRIVVTMYFLYINIVYIFAPCILAENPFIRGYDAMRISHRISKGHKLKLVSLEFSFLGWLIVGALALVAGAFFALAYQAAAVCIYYFKLRPEMKVIKTTEAL